MADVRASVSDNANMPEHNLHANKVGSVDVENDTTLLAASNVASIALWEKTPSAIDRFSSSCIMQCTYFSPSGYAIVAHNARDMNFLFFDAATSTFVSGCYNLHLLCVCHITTPTDSLQRSEVCETPSTIAYSRFLRVWRQLQLLEACYIKFSPPSDRTACVTNVLASVASHASLPVLFAGNSSGTLFVSPQQFASLASSSHSLSARVHCDATLHMNTLSSRRKPLN